MIAGIKFYVLKEIFMIKHVILFEVLIFTTTTNI